MATTTAPTPAPVPAPLAAPSPGLAERLQRTWETAPGLLGALASVDHKEIGVRYLVTAFAFLLVGGLEASVMRAQLAASNLHLLSPELYNALFTMHGVTMMFLYASPVLSGFSNYLWPLMFGARDMAYPRLNALSYWVFLGAGIFLYTSVLVGQMPNAGWFNYVPIASQPYTAGLNIDFYALGLLLLTVSTTVGAVNFVTTFFKLRAPGMSVNRVPILAWGTLTTSFSALFALPALTAACVFLFLDRRFHTHFYDAGQGGHPLLWQHLFWMFGHPWVYIVILPAIGLVSDMISTFTRRRLVGYTWVALGTISTALLGFGVWVHHMFATGVPSLALSFFSSGSMVITIPSAISVFAWIATIWYGRPVFKTPMLFIAGFIVLFVLGGVSGVMTAAVPFDWQLTDTYFVVAHLHYVLVGINVFPVIAAFYYWLPKMTGRMLNETLGKWNFWTMFVGFNLGFFPMHVAGLLGMPRRVYTYESGIGLDAVNLVTTVGSYVFAAGVLLFVVNFFWSLKNGEPAGDNPWDAPTLEWATSSPPPPYNFAVLPEVGSRYPLWEGRPGLEGGNEDTAVRSIIHRGPPLDQGRETLGTTPLDGEPQTVLRMPGDSLWPFFLAVALTALAYALLFGAWRTAAVCALLVGASIIGWLWPEDVTEGLVTAGEG
ncbi:hypothetical protein tb265_21310 [Gemmatimonadetes bacterium T265]|nr:hypothetical protein tb265_21310 [Gemmatimonadetes bacterium T265]